MRNVFFDANVIIDWLVAGAQNHEVCKKAVSHSLSRSRHTYVSPTTVAITCYFLYKEYKSEAQVKKVAAQLFKPFNMTSENEDNIREVFASKFKDVEDALQYFSALHAGVDLIVTQNGHDFAHSKL